jgi:hypothetical protein
VFVFTGVYETLKSRFVTFCVKANNKKRNANPSLQEGHVEQKLIINHFPQLIHTNLRWHPYSSETSQTSESLRSPVPPEADWLSEPVLSQAEVLRMTKDHDTMNLNSNGKEFPTIIKTYYPILP